MQRFVGQWNHLCILQQCQDKLSSNYGFQRDKNVNKITDKRRTVKKKINDGHLTN